MQDYEDESQTPPHILAMSPASHSTWKAKRSNWRKRFGYRPASLSSVQSERDINRQITAYVEWLASARGIDKDAAREHAYSQPLGELISASEARASDACKVELLGFGVAIRTVKSWAGGKEWQFCKLYDWSEPAWNLIRIHRNDSPTTYRVMVDGRMVDSYLSKARARAKAETIADERERAARTAMPDIAA